MNSQKAEEFAAGLKFLTANGFNPMGPLVQAVHETGWFKRVIGGFNFWGMKPGSKWKGPVIDVVTSEFVKGPGKHCEDFKCELKEDHAHKIVMKDFFCDFPTMQEAMDFYDFQINRLYPDAYNNRSNPFFFFDGLVSGKFKWATNPNYAGALKRLLEQVERDQEIVEMILPRVKEHLAYWNADKPGA